MPIKNPRITLGAILAVLFGCFFIFVLPNCGGENMTPAEKAQEEARVAKMEADLYNVQVGDILEFKNGTIYPVTHLISKGCRLSSMIGGQGDRLYYEVLAHRVVKIHKRGTPRWKELCVTYMTPPYQ